MMRVIGIIPARYASTRFPGKPLAQIHGKPMIQWVYERAQRAALDRVVVATDDRRIVEAVSAFGGEVMMTADTHPSGTDRCAEVAHNLQLQPHDVVVNIQGDEPFVSYNAINQLSQLFENEKVQIATLVKPFAPDEDPNNPNRVKVVVSQSGRALYFSRSPIPFYRNEEMPQRYYKHLGIYAYRYEVLSQIVRLPQSPLENTEKLEQLRWLEHDFPIHVSLCNEESLAVDTPEDLQRILNMPHRLEA